MTLLLANNAGSTLANSVSALATTLIIQTADASLFPTVGAVGDYFLCVLEDNTLTPPGREIVRVDARVGNALTVRRAQEGTTARTFAAGATISLRITAGTLAALVAQTITTLKAYPGILRVINNLADAVDPDGVAYLEGQYGIFTGTNTLYRYLGGAWGAALSFPQITGLVANTQLTPGSITNLLMAAHAVTSGTLAVGAVDTTSLSVADIVNNFLKVQTGYVGATQITPNAVTTPAIAAGSVVASALAAGDVVANFLAVQTSYANTAQIVNGAITNAKIGSAAVATANIANAAITTAKIGAGEIQTANIGLLNVTTAHIQSGALSNGFYAAADAVITSPAGDVLDLVVTVPTGDARVVLFFYINVVSGGSALYALGINRDGAPIYSTSGFTFSRSQTIEDTPPAGTHTYSIILAGSGTGNAVYDRELFALVLNK